jgi:hypothetical protein
MAVAKYKVVDGKLVLVGGDDILQDLKDKEQADKLYKKSVNKLKKLGKKKIAVETKPDKLVSIKEIKPKEVR